MPCLPVVSNKCLIEKTIDLNLTPPPGGEEKRNMKEQTLADHAEAWTREQGESVPKRGTLKWEAMYKTWCGWAFSDFVEVK